MKIKHLFLGLIGLFALSACNDADQPVGFEEGGFGSQPVMFKSNITRSKVRAYDGTFEANDQAGVFMLGAANAVQKANANYTTTSSGATVVFGPADNDNTILLPEDGSSVNFVAYLPYKADLSGTTYKVNVSDQSSEQAIDLIYASNFNGLSKTSERNEFKLNFTHQLSKFVVKLKDDVTTTIQSITLSSVKTTADFDLITHLISNQADNADITLKLASDNKSASAILLPGSLEGVVMTVKDANNVTYKHTFESTSFQKGKKYTYTIGLNPATATLELNEIDFTIQDWGVGENGELNLDPETATTNELTIDKTTEDVEAAGGTISVAVTATDGLEWMADSDATWATINPDTGTGSNTVTVTVDANTTTEERTAKITFTDAADLTAILTIKQAGKAASGPTEVTLFDEKFEGFPTGKGKKPNGDGVFDMTNYVTNPDNLAFTYTGENTDLRNRSNVNQIWFPSKDDKFFMISDIPAEGVSNMVLTFDLAGENTKAVASDFIIEVNGKQFNIDAISSSYTPYTIELSEVTPDAENKVYIKFKAGATTAGYRLANIVLKGTK